MFIYPEKVHTAEDRSKIHEGCLRPVSKCSDPNQAEFF